MSQSRSLFSRLWSVRRVLPRWTESSHVSLSHDYLTGLRGFLVLESLVWLFLQTFVPSLVSGDVPGRLYQVVLRKVFSVLLWNPSLIYSFFIILSARTVCVPFLHEPSVASYAGSLIRRPLRIGIPLSIGLAVAITIISQMGTSYIANAASLLENPTITVPSVPPTPLSAFNSIYNLLWVVRDFPLQAGNQFWPSGTLWVPSLIYSQSYTVYLMMVILPFTRPTWHFQGFIIFSLGSFWLQSWGWYSAAGLLLADVSSNPTLRSRLLSGIKFGENYACPSWLLAALLTVVGIALKYIWVAAFPQHLNAELMLHPALHLSDKPSLSSFELDPRQPYPRLDDYMVIVGVLLLLETSERLQSWSSARILIYLGERSLS
ncbi:hypothetical protein H2199_009041 [Coniosporium tulheliwenetii]|uniref:Uncharacterized protein n=1 Tax=Coniosporium tulheliwenetii TaxID=3383036 RepID=A0ACC2YG99_9PEZI|nr:hypothetical protein H2199_009041 [Cladosporium sp. JES 115]